MAHSRPLKDPLLILSALAVFLMASPLWADMQGRLNVVGSALAQADLPSIRTLAVAGFSDDSSGMGSSLSAAIEDGLRKAAKRTKKWTVLGPEADADKADALLTGTYSPQEGQVLVQVLLRSGKGQRLAFSRSLVLSAQDLQEAGLTMPSPAPRAALAEEEGHVIPVMPKPPSKPFHVDVSMGYKAFYPTNTNFSPWVGGRADGASLGVSINDWVLVDLDYWHADIHGLGSVDRLDYFGTALALTYPLRLGSRVTLYGGLGGRFGDLVVHDSSLDDGETQAEFGNNALMAVVGAKLKLGFAGLDLRYNYDLVASYTGYHTLRLGGFIEFGH